MHNKLSCYIKEIFIYTFDYYDISIYLICVCHSSLSLFSMAFQNDKNGNMNKTWLYYRYYYKSQTLFYWLGYLKRVTLHKIACINKKICRERYLLIMSIKIVWVKYIIFTNYYFLNVSIFNICRQLKEKLFSNNKNKQINEILTYVI